MFSSTIATCLVSARPTLPRSFTVRLCRGAAYAANSRKLSITCRGKPISHEELFEYTGGRFLVNEKLQLARRYVKFDVDSLCKVVSAIPTISSPVSRIDKVEGRYHKVLFVTTENGKEVVVKIPCAHAGPSRYTTASEAAITDFVRSSTMIPIPKILAWNSDLSNPVGAEYIVQERARGRPLSDVWEGMHQASKFDFVTHLVRLMIQLAEIHFPIYGNLYFRDSVADDCHSLDTTLDPHSKFCVGPCLGNAHIAARSFKSREMTPYVGPWDSLSKLGIDLAKRAYWYMEQSSTIHPLPGVHHGTKQEQKNILESALTTIPLVAPFPELQRTSSPVLWHPHMRLADVFVSRDDPTVILDIIGWQNTSILPMFTQVRWPSFLYPPDNYEPDKPAPDLPPNFNEMSEKDKEWEIAMRDQGLLSKVYENELAERYRPAIKAFLVDDAFRDLFTQCETIHEDGYIRLRDSLIRISRAWPKLLEFGLEADCPLTYSEEEFAKHKEDWETYNDWCKVQRIVHAILDSDADGRIPAEMNFEEAKAKYKELYETFKSSDETTEQEAKECWVYRERERD